MKNPCPEEKHCFSLLKSTEMCKKTARDSGRGTPGSEQSYIFGWFRPSGRNHTPLICRVVRAVRAVRVPGAGLGFPVGEPSVFTPNLRL